MKKELTGALLWAGFMILLAVVASLARRLGYIDADSVKRIVIGVFGLWMIRYGNRLPRSFAPNRSARQAQKVAGWSMILSGSVYATLWALAPIPVAIWGGTAAVFAGFLVTLGYCLTIREPKKRPLG